MWGGTDTICSVHKTAQAALRAAKACERRGGAYHDIFKVTPVKRDGNLPDRKS